jgi:hypothetical protein
MLCAVIFFDRSGGYLRRRRGGIKADFMPERVDIGLGMEPADLLNMGVSVVRGSFWAAK